jgi:hypothetical protein
VVTAAAVGGSIRLGDHTEVAVGFRSVRFLRRQAGARIDASHPSRPARARGLVPSARQVVVTRGWHQRRVIAPLLRWMDQYLR